MLHSKAKFSQWLPALFDGQFHWDFLKPAFKGTKIEPMDLDAVVERKGHFLIFETKTPGTGISVGQSITLTRLWNEGKTILFINGKSPEEITGYSLYSGWEDDKHGNVGDRNMKPARWEDVVYVTRCWFCKVEGEEKPTRDQWERELWLWDYSRNEPVDISALANEPVDSVVDK